MPSGVPSLRNPMRVWLPLILLALLVGACTRQPETPVPTLAVLPSATVPPPTHTAEPATSTPFAIPLETATPTFVPPTPVLTPTSVTPGDVPAMERRLREIPILWNFDSPRLGAIFAAGQGMGSRANVFTTVGDSNTTNGDFLQPIGMGADVYCDWSGYDYLRATVDFFTPALNSFTHHSIASRKGFSSAAALDPFWATDAVCESGESSVLCEYRAVQPSVAVIMLGGIDINDLTTAEYAANMRAIVESSLQRGVIPVLTTFVVLPERETVYPRSLEFNMALLDIAGQEQTPLINLWAAAQSLPDDGIGPDRTHLKAEVGSFCSFDGAQDRLGGTLRNLLTLQALDLLRMNVLAP
ncbi:MAG: SGNH/GDSL hydrolase family protein [Anaerolineae bacterium]|nr:SGNH/GDSL hydrolase family protein [Anaerolineae bacterium]